MDSVVQLLLTVIVGILVVAVYAHPSSHNGAWNIPTESQRQSVGSQDSYNKDFPALPPSQKAPNVNSPYSLVNRQRTSGKNTVPLGPQSSSPNTSGMKQDDQQGKPAPIAIPGVAIYDANTINTGGVQSHFEDEDALLRKDAEDLKKDTYIGQTIAVPSALCLVRFCATFQTKTDILLQEANGRCDKSCKRLKAFYNSGQCVNNKCCCSIA